MDIPLPSRSALKAQAKRLRAGLADQGHALTHAQALEAIAHQWGARDWNTLSARAHETPRPQFAPGMPISGRYLGHRFQGKIKAARIKSQGFWDLTLVFDTAIDVVTSQHFNAFRKQVNCSVGPDGRSPAKTSDGHPQMALDDHWSS